MNVYLFRSEDCESDVLTDVHNLLSTFPGPLKFILKQESSEFLNFSQENPENPHGKLMYSTREDFCVSYDFSGRFRGRKTLSWEEIFGHCRMLRHQHDIGDNDFVVLLTSHNNKLNWFSAGNPDGPRDHFVHTEDWDYFVGSDRRFPIAYQIATGILKRFVFTGYPDLMAHWHEVPRGCMLDFCQEKSQVSLKVRTGDICPDCLGLFEERKAPPAIIEQVFHVLDGIRTQMLYKSRFAFSRKIPVMQIEGRNQDIIFPELGRLKVHLNPLEKALYLLFLRHPEGILLSHLSDHREELSQLYLGISVADDGPMNLARAAELTDPRSNSASEKISRIKRKLIEALGEEIAASFIISGANGSKKKISADRSLIRMAE